MFAQPDTSRERESLEPQLREKAAGGRRDHCVTRPYRHPYGTENLKSNPFFPPSFHFPSYLTGKGQGWSMLFLGSSAVAGWKSHSGVPTSTKNNSSPSRAGFDPPGPDAWGGKKSWGGASAALRFPSASALSTIKHL